MQAEQQKSNEKIRNDSAFSFRAELRPLGVDDSLTRALESQRGVSSKQRPFFFLIYET